jgi:hypothetical protein
MGFAGKDAPRALRPLDLKATFSTDELRLGSLFACHLPGRERKVS